MAKSMAERYEQLGVEAGRGESLTYVDPKGLHVETDPKADFYDPRCKLPIKPEFVEDLRRNGIKQPVRVRWDGAKAIVIYGIQRVRTALYINENLDKWPGQQPLKIPVLHFKGSVKDALLDNVRENAQRQDETVGSKALKAKKLRDLGASDEELCTAFGTATITPIERWMSTLNFHHTIRTAFESGELTAAHVDAFEEVPAAQQPEVLKAMRETGATKAHQLKQVAKAVKENKPVKAEDLASAKALGRPKIEAIKDKLESVKKTPECKEIVSAPLAMLEFILTGDIKKLHGHGELRELVHEALMDKRTGPKKGEK